jgi:hypothetical protein
MVSQVVLSTSALTAVGNVLIKKEIPNAHTSSLTLYAENGMMPGN